VIYIKVLINENNVPKIYVQLKDILYLRENDVDMPDSIIRKVFPDDQSIINKNNILSYMGFNDEMEIEFFNRQDFIIDLNEYKNLSLKAIEEKGNQLIELINKIAIKYNDLNNEDREINRDIKQMYNHLKYKLDSIAYIYALKKKELSPSFVKNDSISYQYRKNKKAVKSHE
jgi:hypothetical protein